MEIVSRREKFSPEKNFSDLVIKVTTVTVTKAKKMIGMMRYLVETDYLSGSWMRIKEEPFASIAAATGALAHLRGEFPGGPRTRRRGSALPTQVYTHIPRTHLGLNVLAHSPKPSDVSCKHRSIPLFHLTAFFISSINIKKKLIYRIYHEKLIPLFRKLIPV